MNQITKVIVVPIWNKNFFLIHISTNQLIAKLDHNAFLSESEFSNFSLSYNSGGDYSLVPRLQMPGIDQIIDLDKDCDQFALGKIRVIFTNFHEVQLSLTLSS